MSTGSPQSGDTGDGNPVGPLLDRKDDGVAVLVAGEVPDAVHRSMSARLLGSPDVDRRRVLALTHYDESAVTDRLPPGVTTDPDRLRTVFCDGWTRSAALTTAAAGTDAPSSPDGPRPEPGGPSVDEFSPGAVSADGTTVLEETTLSAFGERLTREVAALYRTAGDLDPGQLRLCLDSLDHLTDGYDDAQVLRFAHLVADQVRNYDGMAHFHTRRPLDDLPVPGIVDVTEVVLRLRVAGDTAEFRPYLNGDPLTDWGPIPPLSE